MSYVSKLWLATLATLLAVASTNYVADPYGVFQGVSDDEPLNRELFATNTRLAKAHIISRLRPQAVILGSSRAETAFFPGHPGWQYARVYNLGLPNAGIREIFEYLKHAIAVGEVKQVVVGLDFFEFNPALVEPQADFRQCRLRDPDSLWSAVRAQVCDIPALLFSRRAFMSSIALLFPRREAAEYLRDGSRSAAAREAEIRRMGTQHAAFIDSESRYVVDRNLLNGFLDADAGFEETSGPYFKELLRLCYRHGIDLRLLLSPSHARQWELIDAMGLWGEFVRWKRYLLNATLATAAEYSAEPFPIWDFADYNSFTEEPLPAPDDSTSRMMWHWESSHFRRELGDLVLDQVLSGASEGLGTKLDADNFDEWIQSIDARRADYRRRNATELASMRANLKSTLVKSQN